jgi:hypothetical protein
MLGFENTAKLKIEVLFTQRAKQLKTRWEKTVLPYLKDKYSLSLLFSLA